MKILRPFPKISIKGSPIFISQDIGQVSEITLEASAQCEDIIPVSLRLSGDAKIGEDYLLFYDNPTTSRRQLLPYYNLTTNDFCVKTYIFNNNSILKLYLYPIAYNSKTVKKAEIHIVDEPRVFFNKIPSTVITLGRSNSITVGLEVSEDPYAKTGFSPEYSDEFDAGALGTTPYANIYSVLDSPTPPVVQFSQASMTIPADSLESVTIDRSGDLSQNSVVKLYVSESTATRDIDFVLDTCIYVYFGVSETQKNINLKTIQSLVPSKTLTLHIVPYINSSMGTQETIQITMQ